jgi:hypothetical protein
MSKCPRCGRDDNLYDEGEHCPACSMILSLERENTQLRARVAALETAARDMLSTYREDGLTVLVSAERQEAWQAVIDAK